MRGREQRSEGEGDRGRDRGVGNTGGVRTLGPVVGGRDQERRRDRETKSGIEGMK